jgi:hypothetical protein
VTGETPNPAARLQARAAAGQVLIAESTRRLLGELFDFSERDGLLLKEYDAPIRAYAVVSGGSPESRFGALRGPPYTTGRTRTRAGDPVRNMGRGRERPGAGGPACRRARDRQVATDRGTATAARRRAPLTPRIPRLATPRPDGASSLRERARTGLPATVSRMASRRGAQSFVRYSSTGSEQEPRLRSPFLRAFSTRPHRGRSPRTLRRSSSRRRCLRCSRRRWRFWRSAGG